MANTIFELFRSSSPVEIDLLLTLPQSNDRSEWRLPAWRGYQSVFGFPLIRTQDQNGNAAFSIDCQFLASEGVWLCEAFAVSYQGDAIALGPFRTPVLVTAVRPLPVSITGILNGVL